jgi:hypothetical protein
MVVMVGLDKYTDLEQIGTQMSLPSVKGRQ